MPSQALPSQALPSQALPSQALPFPHGAFARAAILALLFTACGAPPATNRRAPEALDAATITALDPAARQSALDRVVAARADDPDDPDLIATEGHLRHALGDPQTATTLLLRALAHRPNAPDAPQADATDPTLRAATWTAALASGDPVRYRPIAEAAGDHTALDRPADHAIWLMTLAPTDLPAARRGALTALAAHPGNPPLLTAAAAIEARANAWGPALILATRAIDHTPPDATPPRPARSLRAQALAALDPASATDAYLEARAEALPATRRAEALFLLRHGRVAAAAEALATWTTDHPLDAEAAKLAGQIATVTARIDRARAAVEGTP